jgi:hypothetical protein
MDRGATAGPRTQAERTGAQVGHSIARSGFDGVGTRAWACSDPRLLRRVPQNFLSNAMHYAEHDRVLMRHGERNAHLDDPWRGR